MHYEPELMFFRKLLENFHLNSNILDAAADVVPEFDLGLRRLLFSEPDYFYLFHESLKDLKSNIVYCVSDEYLCSYIFFQLPETEQYLIIGPYTRSDHPLRVVTSCAERLSIPARLLPQLEKYYTDLPFIADESTLLVLVNTFGEQIWGSLDCFSFETTERTIPRNSDSLAMRPENYEPEDAFLSMQILEERYASENRLIQAVSQGLVHKAEMMVTNYSNQGIEDRMADPVRNMKNYTIILNTLLRKGAEAGAVHPLHIDSLSTKFAKKLELINSVESGYALHQEMVRKYCLLVKNHSMKGYSLLVRKVLTRIDYDLTADLSLKAQADFLNVTASYLSTLFKKETGMTLTEYVNRKRIEHAVFLLNTTKMQIQTIAQYCGIPDVNYFTKTFKKYIQQTPKEYRENVSPYSAQNYSDDGQENNKKLYEIV
ncbi:MAG: helix-turn-helix transcriptional regulator [Faecalicatena sp.]|uniref:helix-turn-helix domain-containing protein n=1 Tax=Faecalicatena sp. TaxID=2005360 RepID=UPI00258416E5|nr:helix-turn-helix domain-containing protein [Faecalicatena sp.]MCI6466610.1 helix-turn-helix transcriptional regulator [Faecalicatena sp.]MDY5617985.1 helix-turn-helix domain-containing protein [Lachnospiraceae bacterium]